MNTRNKQVGRLSGKDFEKSGVSPDSSKFIKKNKPSISNKTLLIIAGGVAVLLLAYMFMSNISKSTTVDVEPQEFEKLAKGDDIVVLDVRSAFEFGGDKIAGAKNISFTSRDFKPTVEKFDKSKTYLVYCATGSRSVGAVSVLQALGFKSVYNLKGGIDEWKGAGKSVVK